MQTQGQPPQPMIPVRGQVQKTFIDNIILAGFTDDNHFHSIIGEYWHALSSSEQQDLMNSVHTAQAYVKALPPFVQKQVEVRAITHPHISALSADPVFQNAFRSKSFRFAYVDPTQLIALQPYVSPRHDPTPSDETALLNYTLPQQWEVPAEINFIPPQGPIQILSSSPMFQGLTIEFDVANGKVQLGPPKHLNLLQVCLFQGKYYLRNGYHRVADAIGNGVTEIPCLLIDALNPEEVQLSGPTFFGFSYVSKLPRPPLVADFGSRAAISAKTRERRYGMIVKLDISPLNIGI